MKKNSFIDFVNKTGKNIGQVQNIKLANYFEISEGAIRNIKKKEPLKFDCLHLKCILQSK